MARAAVHSFSPEAVGEAVVPGLEIAAASLETGAQALDDLRVRRTGLVISVLIILVFVFALVLKIRQIESGPGKISHAA
jgi:hypothetical protein